MTSVTYIYVENQALYNGIFVLILDSKRSEEYISFTTTCVEKKKNYYKKLKIDF